MGTYGHGELLCILFTDLVGWSALGERVGEERAHALRRDHFRAVRAALDAHRGHEVETVGDSVLATFRSAVDAVSCALAVQVATAGTPLRVRIGVHAGEVADGGDVFGTAVDLAARLCAAAAPGDVLLSELTRALVGRRGAVEFLDAGALTLEGLRDPVHCYRATAPRAAPGPGRAPAAAPTPGARSRTLDNPERSLLCDIVVGRDRELAVLAGAVDELPAGGGLVLLAGEAGVGKTRLARETTALARGRGMTVLAGRAVPTSAPVPYRPLTEAFLGAFRSGRPADAPALEGFGGQLGRLVPEWRTDRADGGDESPILLGEAVVRLLRLVGAGAGCVLVLEDLHWADAETLEVVEYLADTLVGEPALCLCTARPEEAAVESLARLRRLPGATVLGLTRLDPRQTERVVARCLGTEAPPPEVVDSVGANSEGNPFLIEELLAGLVASDALRYEDGRWRATGRLVPSIPFDFSESMRRRLAPFDATARTVLRAAALLGRRFDWELLPGVAEVDGRSVVEALRLAVDEQVVEVDGEVFRFRHALSREAVLGELLPPERRALAQRALAAIERAHPGLPGQWCETAADLAQDGGLPEVAGRHLVTSARRALAAGALTSAERIARHARALVTAADDVDDADDVLVQTLAMAGQPAEAAEIGEALVARLSGPGPEAARRANVLVVLARAAVAGGDPARAQAMVDRAQDLIPELDEAFAARVRAVAAHVALERGELEQARAVAHLAVRAARATDQPEVECEALEVLGRAERYEGEVHDVTWFERSAALAQRHGLASWEVRARHEIALMSAYTQGDLGPLREVRELAARTGALVSVAVMDLTLAEAGLGSFEREACLTSAQRCVAASSRYALATLPVAYLWLAGGYALADDRPAMEAAGGKALEPDPEDPRILGDLHGRVRAASSMVRDDLAQLRRDLDTMMTYVRVAPITTSIYPNRIFWGLLAAIDDDDLGAAAIAEMEAAEHLRHWPIFSTALDAMRAVALGRQGRGADAAALCARADAARPYGADLGSVHYFRMLTAGAALRDGWGDPVAWLRPAEAFFATRGYDRIVRRCRTLLGAAGAPVPRKRPRRLGGAGGAARPRHHQPRARCPQTRRRGPVEPGDLRPARAVAEDRRTAPQQPLRPDGPAYAGGAARVAALTG